MNITTATPAEIDTAIEAIEMRAATPGAKLAYAKRQYAAARKRLGDRDPEPWEGRHNAAHYQADVVKYQAEVDTILAEADPLHAEFDRRGGWTRAYLVLNQGGHVHKDRRCHTCYPTTSYGWLPQESGKTEAEIVDGAGADACTACYPSAPVESLRRPRRTMHSTEVEAAAARAAAAAVKAEKAAAKAAKAEADDLRATVPTACAHNKTISTVRTAKMFLTDGTGWGWDHSYYKATDRDAVADALAARLGTTRHKEIAAAAKRAAKRG